MKMERNKNFKLAESLLKLQWGYVNGQHSEDLSFDFTCSAGRIEVFNSSEDGTFYWPEDVCRVAESCGLSCYVYNKEVDGISKAVFALH